MTPLGGPRSRMRRVSRRVSTPEIPMSPCDLSQVSSDWVGAIVGRLGNRGPQDEPARRRGRGLDVLAVGADIADMGKGEGDDLTGIGGVGQDFLIAGDRGVEADLADGRARPRRGPGPRTPSRPPGPAPRCSRAVAAPDRAFGSVSWSAGVCGPLAEAASGQQYGATNTLAVRVVNPVASRNSR